MATVKCKNERVYIPEGKFHKAEANQPILNENDKLCGVTNPRQMTYMHSYGGEAQFFAALAEGKLLGTRCDNADCKVGFKTIFLPFRIYCPDCLQKATVVDLTDVAKTNATVHTFMVTERTGAFNTLEKPIRFINVQFEGVSTILMSYIPIETNLDFNMKVVPAFRTINPTYTITDLCFVPDGTPAEKLPEGFTF